MLLFPGKSEQKTLWYVTNQPDHITDWDIYDHKPDAEEKSPIQMTLAIPDLRGIRAYNKQRQTAVTAHFTSEQLPLFAFVMRNWRSNHGRFAERSSVQMRFVGDGSNSD